jgi:hypothetical protein
MSKTPLQTSFKTALLGDLLGMFATSTVGAAMSMQTYQGGPVLWQVRPVALSSEFASLTGTIMGGMALSKTPLLWVVNAPSDISLTCSMFRPVARLD